jgi:dethiobiotin synthase
VDFFVTGTDTDVGKTIVSAVLVAALGAAYWKPIQTGHVGGQAQTDRETVMGWTDLAESDAPPEAYLLDPPVSPHLAAREAGIRIDLTSIRRPRTERPLVIEGAGGAMVPLNEAELMLDLMEHMSAPVVVAARTTLGTINHTLLTVDAIRKRGLALIGVVLVGNENRGNRDAIEHYGKVPIVGWIPPLAQIGPSALIDVFGRHFDRSSFES